MYPSPTYSNYQCPKIHTSLGPLFLWMLLPHHTASPKVHSATGQELALWNSSRLAVPWVSDLKKLWAIWDAQLLHQYLATSLPDIIYQNKRLLRWSMDNHFWSLTFTDPKRKWIHARKDFCNKLNCPVGISWGREESTGLNPDMKNHVKLMQLMRYDRIW